MADQKTENDPTLDKLKELERTLAKELDQQVRLSEATDVRLSGSVALNPTLLDAKDPKKDEPKLAVPVAAAPAVPPVVQKPGSSPQGAPPNKEVRPRHDEEISLQDVDNILADLDSDFKQNMDQIKNELGTIDPSAINLESIAISKDYLEEGKTKSADEEALLGDDEDLLADEILTVDRGERSFRKAVVEFTKASLIFPRQLAVDFFRQMLLLKSHSPREVLMGIPFTLFQPLKSWLGAARIFERDIIDILSEYGPSTYFKLFLTVLLSGAFIFVARDIYKNFGADRTVEPYLRSFKDVANDEVLVPVEDQAQDNPFQHPEFIVYLNRIIANLKVPSPRYTSMLAVELYIEASNQEAAIEVHEREMEIKDLVERIAEQTTFEEMDTRQGKEKFKSRIITALNHILNRGRARKVFFKNLQIKK